MPPPPEFGGAGQPGPGQYGPGGQPGPGQYGPGGQPGPGQYGAGQYGGTPQYGPPGSYGGPGGPYGGGPTGGGPYGGGPYGGGPTGGGPYGGPYGGGPYSGGPYGGYGQGGYQQYGGYGQYGAYGRPYAPKPGIIPLRPLTVGEILDGAFTAMRWNPKAILGSSAIVASIFGVVQAVITLAIYHSVFNSVNLPQDGTTPTAGQVGGFAAAVFGLAGVTLIFFFLTNTILTGILTVTVGQGVLGKKETLGSAWRATRGRIWPLIGMVLLKYLIVGGGFLGVALVLGVIVAITAAAHVVAIGVIVAVVGGITAIVFAVIIDVRWTVAAPAVMLEHASPAKALGRSWRLVRNGSWRVFGITLLGSLIANIVGGIIKVPFGLAGGGFSMFTAASATTASHPSDVGAIVSAIGGIVATTVTAPLVAGIVVLLYADLRMRREGMDITLQAAAAGQVPPSGQVPPTGQPAPGTPAPGTPGAPGSDPQRFGPW